MFAVSINFRRRIYDFERVAYSEWDSYSVDSENCDFEKEKEELFSNNFEYGETEFLEVNETEIFDKDEEINAIRWIILVLTSGKIKDAFKTGWCLSGKPKYVEKDDNGKKLFEFGTGSNKNLQDVYSWVMHNQFSLEEFVSKINDKWQSSDYYGSSIVIKRKSRVFTKKQESLFNAVKIYNVKPSKGNIWSTDENSFSNRIKFEEKPL